MYLIILTLAVCISKSSATNCYRCEVSDLNRCDTMVECRYKEVCRASMNSNSNGQVHYSLGCAPKTVCDHLLFGKRASTTNLTRCCNTNFCNKNLFPATTTKIPSTTQLPSAVTCADKLPYCDAYSKTMCVEPYVAWARLNCGTFCSFCHNTFPATTTEVPTTTGTAGCLFSGQIYQQGERFDDGCKFKCICKDASRGSYSCQSKCLTWNLPSECHLDAPAPGKCCKTPNCPSNIIIQYPPGYVAE